ncbi:ATP-grasp ribosomal peptide maturase [Embleya sp. NBC_00888]|uniref:MvdC/MvdD family ATP grasp protein n=1 Tax=Embleya sp. NBC_00888 TaxID=2975960 RepID=UPI003867297C|nr:ATP-grasp ribosomal peptide maturase [Embleya sp. NBC_00888]
MGGSTVLVLAQQTDPSADLVVDALNRRNVPVMRFDVADHPQRVILTAEHFGGHWSGTLVGLDRAVDLESVRAVHLVRPAPPDPPAAVVGPAREWAIGESAAAVYGVLESLPVPWVTRPRLLIDAQGKPRQLVIAAFCGLRTPRTLITSDPAAARAFAQGSDRPVGYKPIHPAGVRLNVGPSWESVPFRLIDPNDLDDSVRATAHLFQEFVPKQNEVRLTVVGRHMFAVAIHAGSAAARVDWRTDYAALTYDPISVPSDVAEGVRRFQEHYKLNFSAMDFVVSPDGTWTFLENNPAGQWGWIELAAKVPIADAIAELLTEDA